MAAGRSPFPGSPYPFPLIKCRMINLTPKAAIIHYLRAIANFVFNRKHENPNQFSLRDVKKTDLDFYAFDC